jgi:beta-lactamase regulating signal transducer with metallopeptidase domain
VDYLLNWLWQGGLLVLVASGHARLSRRLDAAARCRLWWVTLIGVIVAPAMAIVLRGGSGAPGPGVGAVEPVIEVPLLLGLAAPALLALWTGWTALSLARLAAAVVVLRRIKRSCVPFPTGREARLPHWRAARGTGRRAALVLSPTVGSAAVLGGGVPLIAVSPALLDRLTDRELDQIVLHEWAHVQRRDDVAQLVQQTVVALFGLHPAVWWCARQLQLERELACDEYVIDATGSARSYAACLVKLAADRVRGGPLAAPTAIARRQLAMRIARLLQRRPQYGVRGTAASMGAGAIVMLATLGFTARVSIVGNLTFHPPPVPTVVSAHMRSADTLPNIVLSESTATVPRAPAGHRSIPPAHRSDASLEPTSRTALRADVTSPTRPGSRAEVASALVTRVEQIDAPQALTSMPGRALRLPAPAPLDQDVEPPTPWSKTADAGVAIGRGSTRAARATAGFFTRLGKSLAGAM